MYGKYALRDERYLLIVESKGQSPGMHVSFVVDPMYYRETHHVQRPFACHFVFDLTSDLTVYINAIAVLVTCRFF